MPDYLRMPALEGRLGKPWVKLALADLSPGVRPRSECADPAGPAGQSHGRTSSSCRTPATSRSSARRRSPASPPRTTRGTVDYRGDAGPADSGAAQPSSKQQLSAAGTQAATIDVWIDSGRHHAKQLRAGPSERLARTRHRSRSTIEEYGVPVDVTPPARTRRRPTCASSPARRPSLRRFGRARPRPVLSTEPKTAGRLRRSSRVHPKAPQLRATRAGELGPHRRRSIHGRCHAPCACAGAFRRCGPFWTAGITRRGDPWQGPTRLPRSPSSRSSSAARTPPC